MVNISSIFLTSIIYVAFPVKVCEGCMSQSELILGTKWSAALRGRHYIIMQGCSELESFSNDNLLSIMVSKHLKDFLLSTI